jgi:hypothetical protein
MILVNNSSFYDGGVTLYEIDPRANPRAPDHPHYMPQVLQRRYFLAWAPTCRVT